MHTKPWMSATLKTAVLNASVLFLKNRWHLLVLCCRKNRLVKHWMPHWPNTKHALKFVNLVKVQTVTCCAIKLMAAKAGSDPPEIYKDEGYQTFTTEFLSTSTVGDKSTVVNFAFAPTLVGGLGIDYTITPEGWLYTVSYTQEQQEKVNTFVDALKVGGKNLLEFLNA